MLAQNPLLSLELRLLDRPIRLIEEGIDAALQIGTLADSALIARKLGEIRLLLCAAPAYLTAHPPLQAPQDLADHACLVFSDADEAAEWRFSAPGAPDRKITIRPQPRLRANALDVVVEAARAGAGLVRAPSWQIAAHLASGALVPVLPEYEPAPVPLHVVFAEPGSRAPKIRALLDFLHAETGAHGGSDFGAQLEPKPENGDQAEAVGPK